MITKATNVTLNPYEQLKNKYASNALVKKYGDDWNIMANSKCLKGYLFVIDESGTKGKTLSDLQSNYNSDFLTSDERFLALANEAMGDTTTSV